MLLLWRNGTIVALVLMSSTALIQGWPNSIVIAPPRASREWRHMAAIEVQTFDDFGFWEFQERKAAERFVLEQYLKTAERMKGNKYALLVATEASREVVGMVEMGLSLDVTLNTTRTTIGVLCVSPKCQQRGVGLALLKKCQALASSDGWNETTLYVEVEPNNIAALSFFEKNGFVKTNENRTVTVRRRRTYEERPHLVLSKELAASESESS